MYQDKKILVVIPARGGSKRLPDKNIKIIGGKPMISHAITAAKKSKYIDRILVSTDDLLISKAAKKFGAEVPFLRPAELATDTTPTLPVLQHAVRYHESEGKFKPDIIVLIQPTNPLVLPSDIDATIEKMASTGTKSCFSVTEINQRPEWMYHLDGKKPKLFLSSKSIKTKRSQDLPKLGIINGTVYVMGYDTLMKKNKIREDNSSLHIMPRERSVDIDDLFDFELAEFLMSRRNGENNKNRK